MRFDWKVKDMKLRKWGEEWRRENRTKSYIH